MVAFDGNVVALALPVVGRDLASGISIVGWVINGYIIATAALLLQAGKIADRYGRKKIYLLGFALFGLASLLSGVSQNIYELLAFRVFQGASGALITSTASPLVFESFPAKQRGAAIGVNSVGWGAGSVAGPVGGGLLLALNWRFIFYINVPVAIAAILVGKSVIPRSVDRKNLDPQNRVDLTSSALLVIAVVTVIMWLTLFSTTFAIIGLASLLALVFNERRSKSPLLNRELLGNRGFLYSVSAFAFLGASESGIPYVLSYYYQIIVGFPPTLTGLLLAPLSALIALSSPLAGKLFDRLNQPLTLVIIGALFQGLITVALSFAVGAKSNILQIEILMAALGITGGLLWAPVLSTVLFFVRSELRGVANGTAFTLLNIGSAASIAITVAVSASYLPGSAVSQLYLGNFGNFSSENILLLRDGMAKALVALAVSDLIIVLVAFLIFHQERRSPRLRTPLIHLSNPLRSRSSKETSGGKFLLPHHQPG